jgi:hypothetical protein
MYYIFIFLFIYIDIYIMYLFICLFIYDLVSHTYPNAHFKNPRALAFCRVSRPGKLAPRSRLVSRYVGSMEAHTKEDGGEIPSQNVVKIWGFLK